MTAEHFEVVADLYGQARPGYPAAVFDALGLVPGMRVLEIGPGTGLASVPLAARGVDLTCYEIGSRLAALTALAVPGAHVVNAPASEATGSYDLVCGFTSLHWLGDDLWPLAHRLLAPSGRLAVVGTVHISDDEGDLVHEALQPVYQAFFGGEEHFLPRASDLSPVPCDEALFSLVSFETFSQWLSYDGGAYARLHATYSHIARLTTTDQAAFLERLAEVVDAHGGYRMQSATVLSIFRPV